MSPKNDVIEKINKWAAEGIPFLFIIDFELLKPIVYRKDEIDPDKILYNINGSKNYDDKTGITKQVKLTKHPEKYEDYLAKFSKVKDEISSGNSYLLNLTCRTPVDINTTLLDIFHISNARYKLWFEEKFVCFSPEPFITIKNGKIRSFPMKGTIDAALKGAEEIILNDKKETAEHSTIVDLIRNDLNMVSRKVKVERFRYIDTITTNEKKLIQVSSEISGDLEEGYLSKLGDIIFTLLPAGSVSGSPKKKTTEIIRMTEIIERGYYTGVFGFFDGHDLTSSVMIRFLEKDKNEYFYRSGGGITTFSDPLSEYNEMIDKIYVPVI